MSEYDYIEHLTDPALANRLRLLVDSPRGWSKAEREALMLEAAKRLEAG